MNKLSIDLTKEESLVLFDFLSRFSDSNELVIKDKSEELILWSILATLEKNLVEPFDKNYLSLLKDAQNKVKENY